MQYRLLVLFLVLFSGFLVAQNGPIANGVYQLINSSNDEVAVAARERYNQEFVGNYIAALPETNVSRDADYWVVRNLGNGFYEIESTRFRKDLLTSAAQRTVPSSDDRYATTTDPISSDPERQQWSFTSAGNGNFRIINRRTKRLLTLSSLPYRPQNNFTYVTATVNRNSNNQQWSFNRVRVVPKSIKIDQPDVKLVFNAQQQLTVTPTPVFADIEGINWRSSNPTVATVNANGRVTAKATEGSSTIIATVDDIAYLITVRVRDNADDDFGPRRTATAAAFGGEYREVGIGATKRLRVSFTPSGIQTPFSVWTSSDPDIATVSQNGTVTGISEGWTQVRVFYPGGVTASVWVAVKKTQDLGVKFSSLTVTAEAGERQTWKGFGVGFSQGFTLTDWPFPKKYEEIEKLLYEDLNTKFVKYYSANTFEQRFLEKRIESGEATRALNQGVEKIYVIPGFAFDLDRLNTPSFLTDYADMLQTIQNDYGIKVDYSGLANEPQGSIRGPELKRAANSLLSALESRNVDTEVILGDASSADDFWGSRFEEVAEDTQLWDRLAGYATHTYNNGANRRLSQLQSDSKDYWQTEAGYGRGGATTASRILSDITNKVSYWAFFLGVLGEDNNPVENLNRLIALEKTKGVFNGDYYLLTKYHYIKQINQVLEVGAKPRFMTTDADLSTRQGLTWTFGRKPPVNVSAFENPDGSWGLAASNNTQLYRGNSQLSYNDSTTYDLTFIVEDLVGEGDLEFQVWRTNEQLTKLISNEGTITMVNGEITIPNLAPGELVTLRSGDAGMVTDEIIVNQRIDGGQFNDLGTFNFANDGTNFVRIRNESTNGYVIADAVKFSRPGFADVILDTENGGSGITVRGNWKTSSFNAGFQGNSYLHDNNQGQGSKSVTYTPNLPASGRWTVSMIWSSNANRASNARVDIFATGTDEIIVNERINGGQFNDLGTFNFANDGSNFVRIRNTGANGFVIADAIKFSRPGFDDVVLDAENSNDPRIDIQGLWSTSGFTSGFAGASYLHDRNQGQGNKSVKYTPNLPVPGDWKVSMIWTSGGNRASNVRVDIFATGGAPNTSRTVIDDTATSLDASAVKEKVRVYPNPVIDELFLAGLKVNSKQQFLIRDINGRLVRKFSATGTNNLRLDVRDLVSGVYFLQITGELNQEIKFIKR